MGAMLGLAYTLSVIALGCLDEGDERGRGTGSATQVDLA